jgi:hypothetical protein
MKGNPVHVCRVIDNRYPDKWVKVHTSLLERKYIVINSFTILSSAFTFFLSML